MGRGGRFLPRMPDVPKFINTAIAGEVDKEIATGSFDVKSVKILLRA